MDSRYCSVTALSLAGAGSIVARRLTIGSAEGGWVYPYVDSVEDGTWRVLALSCLLVGAGVGASWPLLKRFAADSEQAVSLPIAVGADPRVVSSRDSCSGVTPFDNTTLAWRYRRERHRELLS